MSLYSDISDQIKSAARHRAPIPLVSQGLADIAAAQGASDQPWAMRIAGQVETWPVGDLLPPDALLLLGLGPEPT